MSRTSAPARLVVAVAVAAGVASLAPAASAAPPATALPAAATTVAQPVTARVDAGRQPVALAVDASAGRLYVADRSGAAVVVVDTASNQVLAMVADRHGPVALAVDPSAHILLVANADSTVSVLDMQRNRLAGSPIAVDAAPEPASSFGSGPQAIAVDPARGRAYVAEGDGRLTVLDIAHHSVAEVDIGDQGAGAVAVDPATGDVYVVGYGSDLSAFLATTVDATSLSVRSVYRFGPVSQAPTAAAAAYDPASGTLIAVEDTEAVAIDTADAAVAALPVYSPGGAAVDTVSGQAYLSDRAGTLHVLAAGATSATSTPVDLGFADYYVQDPVAVDPATGAVYVADPDGGVAVIDAGLLGLPPVAAPARPYDFTFSNVGLGAATTSVTGGALPPGLTLSATGRLTGTPAADGLYRFVVTATGSGRTATTEAEVLVATPEPLRDHATLTADAIGYDPVRGRVLVTDERRRNTGNEVTVVDAVTGRVLRRVALGQGPHSIAVDARRAYITNSTDATVTVLDLATLKAVGTVAVGASAATSIAVDAAGGRAFVGCSDGTIAVLDTATLAVTATIAAGDEPVSLAVDSGRARLYAETSSATLASIDLNSLTVTADVRLGGIAPNGGSADVVVDPRTGHVSAAVISEDLVPDSAIVQVGADGTVLARTDVPGPVVGLALDPATGGVDAAVTGTYLGPVNYVAELDASGTVRGGFAVGDPPAGLVVSAAGTIFVALVRAALVTAEPMQP